MKFTRIKIENFRQHRGVELVFDDQRGMFVVVKGKMGAGKTNLLNAFTWCLYGEVDDKKASSPEILNQSVLLATEDGKYVDVSVTIDIDLEESGTATVKRSQSYKKTGERTVSLFESPTIVVSSMESLEKGHVVSPSPEQWIEKFLPYRFKPYFLFDGERLERFFKETDAPLIKNAIQEIARIDVLERLSVNLANAADDALKSVAKLSGVDGNRLSEDFERIQSQIEKFTLEFKTAESLVLESENLEDELDKKLGDIHELERNISDKKRLEREIITCERELAGYEAQFLMHARENGPVAFMSGALLELKRQTDVARANRVLPPPFDIEVLRDLLETKSCICGTALEPGDSHADHIQDLINRYEEISEVGSLLSEHLVQQSAFLAQIPVGFELLSNLNENIIRTESRLSALREDLLELEKVLTGHNDDEVQDLATRRRTVRSNRDKAKSDMSVLKSQLDDLKIQSLNLRRDIEKASATSEKALDAKALADFATTVSSAASDLYREMNDQVRTSVATSLDAQFKQMTWKKDAIKEVTIDSNYKVSVFNNREFEILSKLSAGERLCLAFAFSLTLSAVAGLNFPMVVDTPMGRLSPEVQVHLAKVLADVTAPNNESSGHQMIMLMTETEYNSKVEEALSLRKPKVYEINFNTALAETEITEN